MDALFEEAFGSVISEDEIIPISEDEIYQRHVMSLYSRIKRIEGKSRLDVEEEVLESNDQRDRQTLLDTSPSKNSSPELVFDPLQVKEFIKIETDYGAFTVPIPKHEFLHQWESVLSAHEQFIETKVKDIEEFEQHNYDIVKVVQEHVRTINLTCRNKQRVSIVRRCITALIVEDLLYRKLDQVIDHLSSIHANQDSAYEGLWLTTNNKDSQQFLCSIGTKFVPVTRRYKLDALTTEHLIQHTFTQDHETRAKAKLSMASRLPSHIYNEIVQDPARVLEIATAEACLTPDEIVGLLFPKSRMGEDRICVHCKTTVHVNDLTYHGKCKVVQWLEQRSHYQYDNIEKAFKQCKKVWISPTQRARLIEILRLNAAIKRDIIIHNDAGTTIWKREDDGTLHKVLVSNQKPEDIVGTYEWRRKHGAFRK